MSMKRISLAALPLLLVPAFAFAQTRGLPLDTAQPILLQQAVPVTAQPAATAPAPVPTLYAAPIAPLSPDQMQPVYEQVAPPAWRLTETQLAMIEGALAGGIFVIGARQIANRAKRIGTNPCKCCGGSGRQRAVGVCATCKGTRTVQKEYEPKAKCPNCKGNGAEPCETCEGERFVEGVGCTACEETGKTRDDEKQDVDCAVCKGEGELSGKLSWNAPCPDCRPTP